MTEFDDPETPCAFADEFAQFCEETDRVPPDPCDARAVASAASWFVEWKASRDA